MKIVHTVLAQFLQRGQVKVEISGFDMEGFSAAMQQELSSTLSDIASCAFEDRMTDREKVEAIQARLEQVF
ncbi:hypothetical protein AALA82_07120 [Oscillospiraceae bacterium 50-16]|nr:hypothetical protein [Lawsonibacter sp.]